MHSDWVDVILNGEFVGNYQLCQHIRVSKERVDIFDWEGEADDVAETVATSNAFEKAEAKALETYLEQNLQWITTGTFIFESKDYTLSDYGIDVSAYDKTGGYLFELSQNETPTWMTGASKADGKVVLNMPITANRPEFLKTNTEMLGYAQEKWSNYWAAVISPDGYSKGQHYTDLGDISYMAGYWLAQVIPAQVFNPRARVCSVSLVAHDQGTMRILLTVADVERARPRKMVTVKMAKFDRFLLFSASPEKHVFGKSGHRPKTAEIDQGSQGQRLCVHPANTVGQ